uniref:Septin-2 n=1 Tax=Aceria tosichella TaxID=561515 RepID=A0A6G1SGL0_9ACAR
MPISTASSVCSSSVYDMDTYSLVSQASTTMTIGDSIPAQLVRKTARKGFTFNIMSVGPSDMNKTTVLSALFGRNLEITRQVTTTNQEEMMKQRQEKDILNPPVSVATKTFEIEEKRVKLRLTIAESENYGEALCLKDTQLPLVEYIDMQFADFYKRESSHDRRKIKDKMVHCLFFFISPYGHGLTSMDLAFLKSVHDRVNIVPIIARAETLTILERAQFKRRVKDDLKRNEINIYQLSGPDMDDPDDLKKAIKDIQDAMPFAITSMTFNTDNTLMDRCLDWGRIEPYNLEHSDFSLLKTMLHMQIPDLCEITHEVFYEEFRLRMMNKGLNSLRCTSPVKLPVASN